MTASTPIASLVSSMLADGVEHAAIVRAVQAAEMTFRQRASNHGSARGTRLSSDWQPSDDLVAYAVEQGMPINRIHLEAEKFKNYWTAKTGAAATKRDWAATWRNWILTAMEGRHVANASRRGSGGPASIAGRAPTGASAVLAGMGRLADRLAEKRRTARPSHGQMEAGADAAGKLDFDGGGT
jgi:hypothetical protein